MVSQKDWHLVSGLENVVCSRECAWKFIETMPSGTGYLNCAMQVGMGQPNESFSPMLRMHFRSEYERHVAEALRDSDIRFEYEKYTFPVKNRAHYTPDFHLPQYRVFVEVKGAWGVSAKSKITSFKRLYPTVSLLILPWTIAPSFYPGEEG